MSSDCKEHSAGEETGATNQKNTGRLSRSSMDNHGCQISSCSRCYNLSIENYVSDDENVRLHKTTKTESEEEYELEQRSLSPRTRMSITGVRPEDLSDSGEIEYDDENQAEYIIQKQSEAKALKEVVNRKEATVDPPLYSTHFVDNNDILNSTTVSILNDDQLNNASTALSNSFSSDVQFVSNRNTPIEISSSTEKEDITNKENITSTSLELPKSHSYSPSSCAVAQRLRSSKNLKQLTILDVIKKAIPEKNLKQLTILDASMNALPESNPTTDDAADWAKLSKAVNNIQPFYTGTQGMATFNAQKALTMDALKDLHNSLERCPEEHVLADDPPGLTVPLMDHQKHALAWMIWREKQKPVGGGILADDMGLGKTLTMISLVLFSKIQNENNSDNQLASSDENVSNSKHDKKRTKAYNGGTLVICPASLLRQWENEVHTKLSPDCLTVLVHHGANREMRVKKLRKYDIVLTSYNIVARGNQQQNALSDINWERIILDEAHVVRNHKSQSSVSVCALRANYRWALTGTPIQNKELDVYALIKFLHCSPFDDLASWKLWLANKSAGGQERLNFLMKSLLLRRTKAQLQLNGQLSSLTKKELVLVEMKLDAEEMKIYQHVMAYSRTLFAQFMFQRAEKDTNINYIQDAQRPTYNQIRDPNGAYYKMHKQFLQMTGHSTKVESHEILILLLRLRQICCHPGLIDAMLDEENSAYVDGDDNAGKTPEIDLLTELNKVTLQDEYGRNNDNVTQSLKNVLKRSNPVFNLSRPSSKILKVLEILKKSVLKTNDKAIVVSQWTSVLNILQIQLAKEGLTSLSFNGSIPMVKRQNIINEFNDPHNSKRILLLSLLAGGVGLNLIGANHLILLDLHWNPQLEAQAQDRIYRVGQKKDVFIYKIVCQDTIEERIKALQDKKLEIAEGVLTGQVSSKLSIDDLKGLFGM